MRYDINVTGNGIISMLFKLISTILQHLQRIAPAAPNFVESPDAFREILKRETSRADRYRSNFSLVVFMFDDEHDDRRIPANRLISLIQSRIRSVDYVGWVDRGELGMLMLACTAEQASEMAQTIAMQMMPSNGFLEYSVETYPHASEQENTDGDSVETAIQFESLTRS